MLPTTEELSYFVPECAGHSDGYGPIFELSSLERAKLLVLTLAINGVLEHEALFVSVRGSLDGENWATAALVSFPPKHSCGLYSTLLNLVTQPDIRYMRAQWRMQRLKSTTRQLMFGFYVSVEQSGARITARSIDSLGHSRWLIKAAG